METIKGYKFIKKDMKSLNGGIMEGYFEGRLSQINNSIKREK